MKVAVVGGGSTYTPELVDGFARLRDAAARRGAGRSSTRPPTGWTWSAAFARRIFDHARPPRPGHAGPPISTQASTAPTWCSSSCGSAGRRRGSATRRSRWTAAASARRPPAPAGWPRRCARCRWCSTSPSGSAPGRRPGAWIVDFTNPVGIVTRALLDAGHRAVGLCNVAIGFQRRFAGTARRRPRPRSILDHVGLNHLTWDAAAYLSTAWTGCPSCSPRTSTSWPRTVGLPPELLRTAAASCRPTTCGYFYDARRGGRGADGARRPAAERGRRDRGSSCWTCTPTRRWTEKPALLERARRRVLLRGGGRPDRLAARPTADDVQSVNVRNDGTLPFLPTTRRSSRCRPGSAADGAAPLPVEPVEPAVAGLIAHVSGYEELALDAALRGGRERVYRALLAHPLIGQHEYADALTDLLLAAEPRAPGLGCDDRRGSRGRRRQQQDRRRAGRRPTATCSGSSAAPAPATRASASRRHAACWPSSSRSRRPRPGSTPRRSGRPARRVLPGRRRPAGRGRPCCRRGRRQRLGRPTSWSTTTPSRCCGRAPSRRTRSPWSAARASTAWASPRTGGRPGSRRWGGSPATGAVAGTLGSEDALAAARGEDGRGRPTALSRRRGPDHFGAGDRARRRAALHLGDLPAARLHELAPVLFAVAGAGDEVSGAVVERMAEEVVLLATVAAAPPAPARPAR